MYYAIDLVTEDGQSQLNQRLVQRYGVRKSAVLRSSVFTSPIGGEHYEAYAPLSGDDHVTVSQAFMGEDKPNESWCTR